MTLHKMFFALVNFPNSTVMFGFGKVLWFYTAVVAELVCTRFLTTLFQ